MNQHGNRQKHLSSNPLQQKFIQRFHHQIVELMRQTGHTRLLDVGCAEGFVIRDLQDGLGALQVMGGDMDHEAMLWGREHQRHGVPLSSFDIHRLPFPDDSFPVVMSLEVLEHLPDSRAGLRELARVSSEYVLVSVPHEPLFRGANFLRGKHVTQFGNDPEHLHNYSGRSFRAMLEPILDIQWHGYTFPWQIALGRKRQ